jgi:hypothetical protein
MDIVDIIKTGLRDLPDCIGIVVASPIVASRLTWRMARSVITH